MAPNGMAAWKAARKFFIHLDVKIDYICMPGWYMEEHRNGMVNEMVMVKWQKALKRKA